MRREHWPVTQADVVWADPPDACSYCYAPLGTEHEPDCTQRQHTVVVDVTLRLVVEIEECIGATDIPRALTHEDSRDLPRSYYLLPHPRCPIEASRDYVRIALVPLAQGVRPVVVRRARYIREATAEDELAGPA